jgi:hypothetical protein
MDWNPGCTNAELSIKIVDKMFKLSPLAWEPLVFRPHQIWFVGAWILGRQNKMWCRVHIIIIQLY